MFDSTETVGELFFVHCYTRTHLNLGRRKYATFAIKQIRPAWNLLGLYGDKYYMDHTMHIYEIWSQISLLNLFSWNKLTKTIYYNVQKSRLLWSFGFSVLKVFRFDLPQKKAIWKIVFTSLFTIDQRFIKICDAFDMRPSYSTGQSRWKNQLFHLIRSQET
jgi:hypothetical protein